MDKILLPIYMTGIATMILSKFAYAVIKEGIKERVKTKKRNK